MIPRLHLFEVAELPSCPSAIRDGVTDYLQYVIDRGKPYAPAQPILSGMLAQQPASHDGKRVVDMGSGGGGPWQALSSTLGDDIRITLTDLFPNRAAFREICAATQGQVHGDLRSIRADNVPADLHGLRTIFSAFHHLRRAEAVAVLRSAVQSGQSIAIFEATRRHPSALLITLLTPLFVLLMTPAIRPFSWSRLGFTYLLPVIPLVVLWDGLVSCLRTYTPAELLELAHTAAPTGVEWKAGETGIGPIPITFLVGTPSTTRAD